MLDLYHLVGFNIADMHTHTHYVLYNRADFAVRQSSVKTAKTELVENFPLYSNVNMSAYIGRLDRQ